MAATHAAPQATSLTWCAGDLHARIRWSLTGLEKEMVGEAARQWRERYRGEPLRIGGEPIVAGMRGRDVDPSALEQAMSPPPGPLRYRPARIVSVR